jgi:methionine-rich copper-binding protein CopC
MRSRLIACVVLACAAVAFSTAVATGHAQLVSSDPPDGGTLPATPYTLTATFSEELTPDGSSLVVQDAAGAQVAAGTVSTQDDKQMAVELPQLGTGRYTVLWTAVTADDKAIERGTYSFNVGSAATSPAPQPSASPAPGSGQGTGSGNDVLIALVLGAVVIAGVVGYLFIRNRR